MKIGHHLLSSAVIIIIVFFPAHNALSRPGLTASLGAGYSDNLYADSFSLGNSYLYNAINISSSHFSRIRLKVFYELTYYEYDTYNLINNFLHSPGLSVYRAGRNSRFKWSLTGRGLIKKYTDEISTFDNNRMRIDIDASYFIKSGLQVKGGYQGEISSYDEYGVLENALHRFEIETAKTFATRTTLTMGIAHTIRNFEEGDSSYGWTDLGIRGTQSLGLRTGLSISYIERFWSDGSRPLSTFYIISGVSAYWDSWKGRQAKLSLKRILPSAVLSRLEFSWWDREFKYDQEISRELPWLQGKSSRDDLGFAVSFDLRRQFNLRSWYGKYIAALASGGYSENNSDDDYYSFGNYYIECSVEYSVY